MSSAVANPIDFSIFRAGFPVLREKTYLSICDKMILHDQVRASVDRFLDHLAHATAIRTEHEVLVTSSREKFARLMNVSATTVAAVRNVSDGVNAIAWAFDWKEGDNVVLTGDAEHPNNIYPWLRLRERGVEVRLVPAHADGGVDADALIAAMTPRTRVLTAASATFAPGQRTDLAKLGDACAKHGAMLLVDGVQTAGIFAHDLIDLGVGAFATSTSKGLLGLYGYGFLYVDARWIDRLRPAYLSRAGIRALADDHSAMGGLDWDFQPDARRFEVGSFNLAGAYAADASLGLLLDLGIANIERHVLDLSTRLHEGVAALGLTCASSGSGLRQSHILTLGQLDAGGHGFSSDPLITPISEALFAANVAHTIRRGQLRFGLHAYNNRDDVDHALAVMGEVVK